MLRRYLVRCDTSGFYRDHTAVTELETPRVLVYPNPVRDEVVYFQAPSPAPRTVQLLDAAGRIVLTHAWTTESLALSQSSLSAGWYIVEIRGGRSRAARTHPPLKRTGRKPVGLQQKSFSIYQFFMKRPVRMSP